jgi:hypothetical protein
MDWIGGLYIHQIRRLGGEFGVTGINAFAEFMGGLLIVAARDLLLFNGSTAQSLVDGKVRRSFFLGVDAAGINAAVRVFVHQPTQRIYLSYSRRTQGTCRTLVCNYDRSSPNAWGELSIEYHEGFDSILLNNGDVGVLGWFADDLANQQNRYIAHHSGFTDIFGDPVVSSVERVGMSLNEGNLLQVNYVRPEIVGDSEGVDFYVGGQMALEEPVSWDGPYTIIPNQTELIDPRVVGKFISWKVESATPGRWYLGAITIDWEPCGGR